MITLDNVATTPRIVLAEPDPALRRLIARRFEQEGCHVRPVESARDVFEALDHAGACVVVLASQPGDDVMSPLRSRSDAPVIAVLPAGTEVGDALDMLDAGADNYVVRPFSPRELVSRVNALWRRLPEDTRDPSRHFAFDGLTIDVANREVTVDDKPVNLAAKEFDLLVFLAASPRQVFSRDQLMRQVWGVEVALATATITEHVRRLRNRIERDPRKPRWIETVWSVGYRFNPGERRAAT